MRKVSASKQLIDMNYQPVIPTVPFCAYYRSFLLAAKAALHRPIKRASVCIAGKKTKGK